MAERGGGRALNDEGVFVDTQRMSVSSGDSGREPGVRPLMGDRELCVCVVMPDMGHWSGYRWGVVSCVYVLLCQTRAIGVSAGGGSPMVTKDTYTFMQALSRYHVPSTKHR